jgi:peptidoglycan-associated lipoprotein
MPNSNRMTCYFSAIVCALLLGACASSAPKPEEAAAGTGGGKSLAAAPKGEGERGKTKDTDATPGSSLDQLKEGKSPVGSGPLKDIYFDFDRYDLREDARGTLKANADWLKKNPAVRVEIEGHCDDRGTNEYNLALGAKRAQSAKDYLATLGITGERLSTISYGEEIPVCRDQSEECRSKNRRARFVIVQGRPAS